MISLKPLFAFLAYHNISIKELSEKSGVAEETLSKMKKTNSFTFAVINKICTTLNLDIEDIMRYEDKI